MMILELFKVEDFKKIKSNSECKLMNDIDFADKAIKYLIDDFRGIFDGNGHVLKNITISDDIFYDGQTLSLIKTMFKARVKNLTIKNLKFNQDNLNVQPNISTFCGECEYSEITNVQITYNSRKGINFVFQSNHSNYKRIKNTNLQKVDEKLINLCYNDIINN